MTDRIREGNLLIAENLHKLVCEELLPGTGVGSSRFWSGLNDIVDRFASRNAMLLQRRNDLQSEIDRWHDENSFASDSYKRFLQDIGYLLPEGESFEIKTRGVDPEIATMAAPQLIVPVSNARYALNAANARWGSLYDALYGTDAISENDGCQREGRYNPMRGARVVAFANSFLDRTFPVEMGSHDEVVKYTLDDSNSAKLFLRVKRKGGDYAGLVDDSQFVGFKANEDTSLEVVLLRHNGLTVELHIDRAHPVGATSLSGLKDVILESAVTTIQDCEDSVAAVDADDKCVVYRNWLRLMQGTLSATFEKAGRLITRSLNPDRQYTGTDGKPLTLPGRSLLLVRNVGHLMTTGAVTDLHGNEIPPEGFLDAIMTVGCALHDLNSNSPFKNSRHNSIYIVKPKMHGPEEVALTDELFSHVEQVLGLDPYTIKVGLMDEERRTSVNLIECIRALRNRVVFINTGFLDRTGDEIHTCMRAGPILPKEEIKGQPWILAYEERNVNVGLRCGFAGRAQIGKGMWAKPDNMREMIDSKVAHPLAGASCAWVPSPAAATLHALHYHAVNVKDRQRELAQREAAALDDMLILPLLGDRSLPERKVQAELDNNVQGILGYVVRWIQQGIGCSKVLDINNVGLMEDRATLRISSQHIVNWLRHGVVSKDQVGETMLRMAAVVDKQNVSDPLYEDMIKDPDNSIAFQAACDLIFRGDLQPNGYTELVLHARRYQQKARG